MSTMATSHNLMNAAHYDAHDVHHSIATWMKEDDTKLDFWYFTLPNVTRDKTRGMLIKIKHGLTISMDARKVMHCSTHKSKHHPCNACGAAFYANK